MRQLSELSLEELYRLFPITLVPYNEQYPIWFEEEKNALEKLLDGFDALFSHIGSTAIPDLISKPIVDILCEVSLDCDIDNLISRLSKEWILMSKQKQPLRVSFNKGYTINGYDEKVYHLHVVGYGDRQEIHFRDVLRENISLRQEYEELKIKNLLLAKEDRDLYTSLKNDFVQKVKQLK